MNDSLGEPSDKRIAASAADTIRQAIEEAGGREVFFAGSLDGAGIVEDVRVVARGHEGAVPAFFDAVGTREVVLHNHPSGSIGPSDADLQLASIFGHHGHGVFIVDNSVSRVYTVVEPFLQREVTKLDAAALGKVMGVDGRLARLLPGYEVRPQQRAMLEGIAKAFNHDGVAVVEAPTGVGKTLAYLVPSIAWAQANKERVVVTTRTINLQEQIIEKDLPLLQKCVKEPFTACLVKGRSNYLCRRKLQRALSEATLFEDKDNQAILHRIADWAEVTEDGSLSDLPFMPPREMWNQVCSEADTCSFAQCPAPGKCCVGRARRDMAKADVLVVNHHMLFADVAIKAETGRHSTVAVLPPYQRVIFDEAHNIEDAATEYFGAEVTRNGAIALLGRFLRADRGRERGLLPYLKVKLMGDAAHLEPRDVDPIFAIIDNGLAQALATARERIDVAFGELRDLVSEKCKKLGGTVQWRLTESILADPDLREIHTEVVVPAANALEKCATLAGKLVVKLKQLPIKEDGEEAAWQTELIQLDSYRLRLQRAAGALAEGTSETLKENTVRWIEINGNNKNIVRITRCPLEVSEPMAESVYPYLKSVVMTSATLSVGRSFDYLNNRLGLNKIMDRSVESFELDSPFNFEEQAILGIPTDLAAPSDPQFLDQCVTQIREVLRITKGHAFVLFTSFYALDFVHQKLKDELKEAGIHPLKQGETQRSELLNRFRSDPASVLFATDSFWEGVDVAGDALQCVILPRLPFRVPTEPIQEARVEAIEAAGGNAFLEYSVPQAVIKFRQGFGRLIRSKRDRGAVVVLDKRIVTKRYGRLFLESLPGVRVVKGPGKGVHMALETFFDKENSPHE
jgi:ATP-dependent DNA helicase DinG